MGIFRQQPRPRTRAKRADQRHFKLMGGRTRARGARGCHPNTNQGRFQAPTAGMLVGSGSVAQPCRWKVPMIVAPHDLASSSTTRQIKQIKQIDPTDCPAYVVPFGSPVGQHQLDAARALDAGGSTEMHKRALRLDELEQMWRRSLVADAAGANGYIPAWIVLSRCGKKLRGARTEQEPIDPTTESYRRSVSESILQAAGFFSFDDGQLGIPAIACGGLKEGVVTHSFTVTQTNRIRGAEVNSEVRQLCVALQFAGPVLEVTPPGNRNVAIAVAMVRERPAAK